MPLILPLVVDPLHIWLHHVPIAADAEVVEEGTCGHDHRHKVDFPGIRGSLREECGAAFRKMPSHRSFIHIALSATRLAVERCRLYLA
ncbi:hypothetical protein ANANG_G00218560 [Anguilla anguilla]|uniref:Uncharacterized protein n=1 Tax=Anguilla anguilla TaxID=7936 RepID=A0A9D3LXE5_ANGAN|nr:hypothetical protein ANANG_G00218560 [Anguilla anguilla]